MSLPTNSDSKLNLVSQTKSFGGWHKQFSHASSSVKGEMRFAVYFPPQYETKKDLPVLYWLSGLTCTDENFMQKAGAHRMAAQLGIVIVAPDTSPRGDDVANDEGYDLGQGAGFYVNATQAPWSAHYHMYDYVVIELPELIEKAFEVSSKRAISGHSMGGHGALMIALKNPDRYSSVSAFSPISNPMDCPWGHKAFSAYLGEDQSVWAQYDSSVLMSNAVDLVPALVDQGLDDNFLQEQLKPEALEAAAAKNNYPLTLNRHEGYDHSYYFISSFIDEHFKFHAGHLMY